MKKNYEEILATVLGAYQSLGYLSDEQVEKADMMIDSIIDEAGWRKSMPDDIKMLIDNYLHWQTNMSVLYEAGEI